MRRPWVLVAVAFAVSRLLIGWIADHPEDVYPSRSVDPSVDTGVYEAWAFRMQEGERRPYADFEVEYPPGALLVANLPFALFDGDDYQRTYIAQSIAFDALGLAAVYRVAKRRRSWWGVAAWLLLVPLLGPVAYTRLDIVVAAALAWALERVEAGRWTSAGAWLGLGAAVKLTPVLVLPAIVLVSPRRWQPVAAAAAVGVAFLVPFVGDLPDVVDQVAGYHVDRGVHAESLWGSLALLARVVVDADVEVVSAFGAVDISASAADGLKTLSNIAAIGVLVDSAMTAHGRVRRGDGAHLAIVVCATLTLLVAVGRVFSPQYLVWLVAPIAVALSVAPRAMRWPAVLLGASTALAHVVYPVLYDDYVLVRGWGVGFGVARNLLLLASGLLAARVAAQRRPLQADRAVGRRRRRGRPRPARLRRHAAVDGGARDVAPRAVRSPGATGVVGAEAVRAGRARRHAPGSVGARPAPGVRRRSGGGGRR